MLASISGIYQLFALHVRILRQSWRAVLDLAAASLGTLVGCSDLPGSRQTGQHSPLSVSGLEHCGTSHSSCVHCTMDVWAVGAACRAGGKRERRRLKTVASTVADIPQCSLVHISCAVGAQNSRRLRSSYVHAGSGLTDASPPHGVTFLYPYGLDIWRCRYVETTEKRS